jgi:poly(hydroxyalkanoate) granule-associated protein
MPHSGNHLEIDINGANRATRRRKWNRQGGFEMAKKKAQELQNDVVESAHKIWLAGLGSLALAEEEGGKLFKSLVDKGKAVEGRGKEKVEQARGAVSGVKTVAESYWDTFERTLDEKFTAALHRIGVPTKDEIENLTKKVEELTVSIDKLRAKDKAPARRTTSRAKSATTSK